MIPLPAVETRAKSAPKQKKARVKKAPKRAPKKAAKKPNAPLPNDTTEAFAKFEPAPPEDEDAAEPFDNWGGFTEEFEAVVDDEDSSSVVSYEDSVTTDASMPESLDDCDIGFDQPESPRASIWSAAEKRLKPAKRASWRSSGSRVMPDCDDDIF